MEILHQRLNKSAQVKGSILLRENGLHLSSILPPNIPQRRQLSAYLANVWRQLYKSYEETEGIFRIKDDIQVYMKYLPSKNLLFSTFSSPANDSSMKEIMNHYASLFTNLF
ncbi:MAG: hypothetical protein EU536_04600 [Promethearchaeota archaeon]|nr:MAG: hypothetical protein EU536_04600 [Candidatus Lokiarchaeota archaeon]